MEQNQSIVLKKEDFQEIDGMLYMPIRELARRMGYKEARRLKSLYYRHQDELSQYAMVTTVGTIQGDRETVVLNELGCYTIAMLSETPKAKEFRKQLANLIMSLRKQNLQLVPPQSIAYLEWKMKSMSDRIRRLEAQQAVYYIAERERLCGYRRWNMSKKQYDNIVRMLKKSIVIEQIADMLAVPVWIVKKAHEIEVYGGHDYGFGFLSGKTRAEINAWIDEGEKKSRLTEAGGQAI